MEAPIRAGSGLIEWLFDLCANFLTWLAARLHVTYQTVNVWIFCVIWPLFTASLIGLAVWQWLYIRRTCP